MATIGETAWFVVDRSLDDLTACSDESWEWYHDGVLIVSGNVDGFPRNELVLPAVAPADSGAYHFEVERACQILDPNDRVRSETTYVVSLPARLTVIAQTGSDFGVAFTIPTHNEPLDVALLRRTDQTGAPVVAVTTSAGEIELKEVKGVVVAQQRATHVLGSTPSAIRAGRYTEAVISTADAAYELAVNQLAHYELEVIDDNATADLVRLQALDAQLETSMSGITSLSAVLGDGGGSGCNFPGFSDPTTYAANVALTASRVALDVIRDGAALPQNFIFRRDLFDIYVVDPANNRIDYFADQDYDPNGTCAWEHTGWTLAGTLQLAGTSGDIDVLNVDQTGAGELIVSRFDSNRLEIYSGPRDPNVAGFVLDSDPNVGAAPHSIVTGDWNGDGIGDLAVTNHMGDSVSVLEGDGLGGFSKQRIALPSGAQPLGIDAGDMDGDGRPDLAVACSGTNEVAIILNAGRYALCDVVNDCDENGIDDTCDLDPSDPDGDGMVATDANGNGLLDACDCFADVDGSGSVDLTDLAIVLSNFDQTGPNILGDVDLDGDVDLTDLAVILSQFDSDCD